MIKFKMAKIRTEQFAILAKEAPSRGVNLETQLGFKSAIAERQIACDVIFKFETKQSPFLMLNILCTFEIASDDWTQMTQDDTTIRLPKGFLCHIAMHTVGTARGILHAKTENTPFNCFILPTINVERMVEEDLVINVAEDASEV